MKVTTTKPSKWKGYASLVFAGLIGAVLLWNWVLLAQQAMQGRWPDLWTVAAQFWRVVLFGYFAFLAYKHLGRAENVDDRSPRPGWGRIVFGAWLIFSGVQQQMHPIHSRYEFKASNEAEARGMSIGEIFVPIGGLSLFLWGLEVVVKRGKVPLRND